MLKVKVLRDGGTLPTVAHPGEDLGYDLYASETVTLLPGVPTKVPTAVSAEYVYEDPEYRFGLLVRDRSSMALKGITVSAGVVDAGYRGEIVVLMTLGIKYKRTNYQHEELYSLDFDESTYTINKGDKIAQLIPLPVLTNAGVVLVDSLAESARGENGFGSSGQ